MVDIVLKILLLLSPIIYGVGIELNNLDILFFRFGVIALFTASLFDIPKRNIDLKLPILLLLGLGLLNIFWNGFQNISIGLYSNLFFAILAIIIITRYAGEPKTYYKYILIAGCINIAVFLFQKLGYNPIFTWNGLAPFERSIACGGMFGNANRFMTYLGIIYPVFFNYAVWYFPVFLIISLLTSEYSFFGVAGIVLFMSLKRIREKMLLLIAIGLAVIKFYPVLLASVNFRLVNVIKPALEELLKRPLLGYGFGTFYLKYGNDPLNSYLPFIYGIGLGGAVWLGYVIYKYRHRFNNSVESLGMMSVLFLMLIEYPIEIIRNWFTIVAIVSFFLMTKKEEIPNDSPVYRQE